MKILSDQQMEDCCCNFREVAIEAQKDTLRQARELLDGIETGKHPSKPHRTICCMHCGNWNSIDDEIEQAKYEAIQTMKALLEG